MSNKWEFILLFYYHIPDACISRANVNLSGENEGKFLKKDSL